MRYSREQIRMWSTRHDATPSEQVYTRQLLEDLEAAESQIKSDKEFIESIVSSRSKAALDSIEQTLEKLRRTE